MKQTRRVYFLLCIEFIYFQTIPLIAYLRGNADHRLYMDFAMPIVHILVLNGVLFLFYFSSYCYFFTRWWEELLYQTHVDKSFGTIIIYE